jgi:hypothetical protein
MHSDSRRSASSIGPSTDVRMRDARCVLARARTRADLRQLIHSDPCETISQALSVVRQCGRTNHFSRPLRGLVATRRRCSFG